MVEKILRVPDSKEAVMAFIREHFTLILPFEVKNGYDFSIRISEEQYEELTAHEIELLEREIRYVRDECGGCSFNNDEEKRRWLETHYWTNTHSYIFHYHTDRAYVLDMRCEYDDVEGLTGSVSYLFIDDDAFEQCIMDNIDKYEGREWRRGAV